MAVLSKIGDSLFQWPVIAGSVAVCFGYYVYSTWQLRRNLPPGPWPLPVVGNLLMLRGPGTTQDKLIVLAEKYGDPMTFWLGNMLTIVMSSKDTIRQVLISQQHNFCSRQDSTIAELLMDGSQDIALAKYGSLWQVHRKLASRSLRNIVGGEALEKQVQEAVAVTEKALLESNGPVGLHEYLVNTVFNVICSFAYGKMYAVDDEEFLRLMYLNRAGNDEFMKIIALDFIPGTKYLPLERMFSGVHKTLSLSREMLGFIRNHIKEHRKTYTDEVTRDFTDAMIMEQKSLIQEGEKDVQKLTEDHLAWIVIDFYNAGTDTTSSTMTWLFLFMAVYPDIQERCYKEITEAIDKEPPKLSDRPSLPFVEACIYETLRMRGPTPLGVPHVNITPAKLGPYSIPTGTVAIPNMWAMHVGKKGFFGESAGTFDPEGHFLEDDKVTVKKPSGFLPFGAGKRVCLGEQLARNNLFLLTVTLLQRFKFSKVQGEEYCLDPDPKYDALIYASPYKVNVESR